VDRRARGPRRDGFRVAATSGAFIGCSHFRGLPRRPREPLRAADRVGTGPLGAARSWLRCRRPSSCCRTAWATPVSCSSRLGRRGGAARARAHGAHDASCSSRSRRDRPLTALLLRESERASPAWIAAKASTPRASSVPARCTRTTTRCEARAQLQRRRHRAHGLTATRRARQRRVSRAAAGASSWSPSIPPAQVGLTATPGSRSPGCAAPPDALAGRRASRRCWWSPPHAGARRVPAAGVEAAIAHALDTRKSRKVVRVA
jgi:hypothetical protein